MEVFQFPVFQCDRLKDPGMYSVILRVFLNYSAGANRRPGGGTRANHWHPGYVSTLPSGQYRYDESLRLFLS